MIESVLADTIEETPIPAGPNAFQTIVYGGLTVGVFDGIAACVNAGIRGISPVRVFQYVASSLLGREAANEGGAATVALGILLHFCVAFGVATVFFLLSSRLPILLRYYVISGMIYGIAVYFAMAYAIVPLTKVTQGPFNWSGLITSNLIHMFFVGLPVAIWAKRSAISKASPLP